tara:strand:+ start:1535 stop:1747 length:213 start_codon:yes stop_codon:yes gene_type:complete
MPRNFDEIQARVTAGETISAIAATEGVTKQALSKWLQQHQQKRRVARIASAAAEATRRAVGRVMAKELRS